MAVNSDFSKLEKELVAEQPGFVVGVVGLFISLFIGLAVRSALSPERILHLVETAAAKIDTHLVAKVGSARVSLADGFFPELAVVVKDLSLESEESCWFRPSLEVDEFKLPLDLWKFFSGQIHIHEIFANEVNLSLRSDLSSCKNKVSENSAFDFATRAIASSNLSATESAASIPAVSSRVSLTDKNSAFEKFSKSRDSIDFIQIEKMRIHYLPLTFTSIEIRNLELKLGSKEPKKIMASGILSLNGETLSGDYSSTAALRLDYQDGRDPDWKMSFDGNWREGHYLVNTDFDSTKQTIKIAVDMEQIPLNQLFPLLRKYHLLTSDFNGRQVWLSLKGGLEGPVGHLSSLPAQIEKIRIDGNIGEIEAQNLEIEKLDPFVFKPIDVEIKSLQLDSLMSFLNRPHLNPILGHLGVFHGKAHIEDAHNVKIKGENTGFEFVFSSRGLRQVQPLSLIAGEIKFSNSKWNIKVDRVKPVEGVFLGDLDVEADHNWNHVAVKAKVDDLTLGPTVQKVITNGGSMGSVSGDLRCRFDEGNLTDIQANISTTDFSFEKIKFKRSKFALSSKNKDVWVDLKMQGILIDADSPVNVFMKQFFEVKKLQSNLEINRSSARIRTHFLDDFYLEDFNIQSATSSLQARGGWDVNGQLQGEITSKEAGVKSTFKVSGFRDKPLFIKQKN